MADDFYPFVDNAPHTPGSPAGEPSSQQGGPTHAQGLAGPLYPARIAVYDDMEMSPRVAVIEPKDIRDYLAEITSTTYDLMTQQGGTFAFSMIRELVENYIHAAFVEPTISILDHGQTLVFSDQGPGIPNKRDAMRPSFTSATLEMKKYIRGVGSGLPIVEEYVRRNHGTITIEDNLGHGTIVTVSLAHRDDPAGQTSAAREGAPGADFAGQPFAQAPQAVGSAWPASAQTPAQAGAAPGWGTGYLPAQQGGYPTQAGLAYGQGASAAPAGYQPGASATPGGTVGAFGYPGYPYGYPAPQATSPYPAGAGQQAASPAGTGWPGVAPAPTQTQAGWGTPQGAYPTGWPADAAAPSPQQPGYPAGYPGAAQQVQPMGYPPSGQLGMGAGAPGLPGAPAGAAGGTGFGGAGLALSEEQLAILRVFTRHEGVGPKELTAELGLSAASGSRRLAELQETGCVIKRGQKYQLTDVGRQIVEHTAPHEDR